VIACIVVKRIAAIVFSLLLIVSQTLAVAMPVSSRSAVAKQNCCGKDCYCCVSESGAASIPPIESAAPVVAQIQFVVPPAPAVSLRFTAPPGQVSSSPAAECRIDLPLYRQNCALLI
jgi:hypothetical protein